MIAALAAAEFKERVRKPSFLMLIGAALLASFYFVPNPETSFRTLIIGSNKFIQADNPTWIPIAAAIIAGLLVPIAGFAFCHGSIGRDRKNGLYYTLHAQGMRRINYVTGKFLANIYTLLLVLLVVAAGSFCMINVRFFLMPIEPWAFISPFLAVLPGLVFTAAGAVLFECIPFFRNTAPLCIALFFIFHFAMLLNATSNTENPALVFDISGYAWLHDSITSAAGSDVQITVLGGGSWISSQGTEQLVFTGLPLTANRLLQKLILVICSFIMLVPSALFLEPRPAKIKAAKIKTKLNNDISAQTVSTDKVSRPYISAQKEKGSFLTLFICELHRMIKELPRKWLLIEACLFAASIFVPIKTVYTMIIPIMFGMAVLPFAKLGTSGCLNGMDSLINTIFQGSFKKAAAECLSALSISAVLSFAALIRGFAFIGAAGGVSLLLFVLFTPLAAYLIGRLFKTPRVFELLYLTLIFVILNAPGLIIKI